jgi:hypothetical protein
MADLVTTINQSNLPAHAKASMLDHWIDRARGAKSSVLARAGVHGLQAAHTVTEYGAGLITGAAAGAIHATVGLDKQVGDTTVPMDAVAAAAAGVVAIGAAHMPGARQAGIIGAELATIFSFRKVYDYVATKRKAAGQLVGGTFAGEDHPGGWAAPSGGQQSMQAELQALAASLQPVR